MVQCYLATKGTRSILHVDKGGAAQNLCLGRTDQTDAIMAVWYFWDESQIDSLNLFIQSRCRTANVFESNYDVTPRDLEQMKGTEIEPIIVEQHVGEIVHVPINFPHQIRLLAYFLVFAFFLFFIFIFYCEILVFDFIFSSFCFLYGQITS